MSKVRILHLITGLPIGGAEKVLLDLCANLDEEKFENCVVGLNDERDFFEAFEEVASFVTTLDMPKTPAGFFDALGKIDNLIADYGITVLHAHMFHPVVFALIEKIRRPGLRVVFTSHNENIGGKVREAIVGATKRLRDADILFSNEMRSPIYRQDALIIPNGIDTKKFTADLPKNDRFTFVAVGVLREQKNHVALPAYAAWLKERGHDFMIWIVGSGDASGDTSARIEEAIERDGVEEYVRMLGARRDIPEILQKAHCFVMPSHFEGLPIALLEAGAAALPVVTTPVGAIPSVIDERSGYLASHERFAQRMEEVLIDYQKACEKGRCLREIVSERFSIGAMAKAHETLYRRLAEGG